MTANSRSSRPYSSGSDVLVDDRPKVHHHAWGDISLCGKPRPAHVPLRYGKHDSVCCPDCRFVMDRQGYRCAAEVASGASA